MLASDRGALASIVPSPRMPARDDAGRGRAGKGYERPGGGAS
jgi:hypothetical protein